MLRIARRLDHLAYLSPLVRYYNGHRTLNARIPTSKSSRLVFNGLLNLNTALSWTKDHLTEVHGNLPWDGILEIDAHVR